MGNASSTPLCDGQKIKLLIAGFAHEMEVYYKLNIPSSIIKMIVSYYPVHTIANKFGYFDKGDLESSDEGKSIVSINTFPGGLMTSMCIESNVYPQYFAENGYNKGIHYFSIKLKQHRSCTHYVGITMEKDTASSHSSKWFHLDDDDGKNVKKQYLFPSYNWKGNDIVTTKLDCDNWNVTYFVDNVQAKQEKIRENQCYFLILRICVRDHSKFEIIPTNVNALKLSR